jgi:hypothetical protein
LRISKGVVKNGPNDALETSDIVTFILSFIWKSNNTPAIRGQRSIFFMANFVDK